MIKNIIFDYDGTIADSVDIKTKAFAELYRPYGKHIVDKVIKYHITYGGISRFDKIKYFHAEYLNISLKDSEIKELSEKFSKLVVDKVINAPYVPGAYEFISSNYNNYNMYISTATPTMEIISILNQKRLKNYFKGINGSPDNKVYHVKNIIFDNNYLTNETVFVGDSITDLEAAKKNNIHFVGIGRNKEIRSEKFVLKNLIKFEDILKILNKK